MGGHNCKVLKRPQPRAMLTCYPTLPSLEILPRASLNSFLANSSRLHLKQHPFSMQAFESWHQSIFQKNLCIRSLEVHPCVPFAQKELVEGNLHYHLTASWWTVWNRSQRLVHQGSGYSFSWSCVVQLFKVASIDIKNRRIIKVNTRAQS